MPIAKDPSKATKSSTKMRSSSELSVTISSEQPNGLYTSSNRSSRKFSSCTSKCDWILEVALIGLLLPVQMLYDNLMHLGVSQHIPIYILWNLPRSPDPSWHPPSHTQTFHYPEWLLPRLSNQACLLYELHIG